MYKISATFANSRQLSVQEAVYLCLPELCLRKTFPKTLFVNSNFPTDRIKIFKPEHEIKELDPESTDVFKRSLLDRYIDRPNATFCKGKYAEVDCICLAMFASYYYVDYDFSENDSQLELLTDEFSEQTHESEHCLPKNIPLMSCSEHMKCRKVKQVLRYHVPNEILHPEKFAHHILFMFHPFRN